MITKDENFSWKTLDSSSVYKELDFSSFRHGVSVIPQSFYSFFEIKKNKDKQIAIFFKNKKYEAELNWTRPSSPVVRIFWRGPLTDLLKKQFPDWVNIKKSTKNSSMKMVFKRSAKKDVYEIVLLQDKSIEFEDQNLELKIDNKILKIGDKVLRKKLAKSYNTATQGGITPSNKNKLIFIFSDPKIGEKYGYNDGYKDGVFFYSGRGPKGDMELTLNNKSIIQTLENNFRIFVFGGTKGSVIYEGEFNLDKKLPYIEDENLDEDGVLRTAILFRLIPNKRSKTTLIPKSNISVSKQTSCKTVPLEKGDSKKTKSQRSKQEIVVERNEKKLVNQYSEYLRINKYGNLERNEIKIKNENTIYTDGWLKEKRLLIEAK